MKHWVVRATGGASLVVAAEVLARAANMVFFVLLIRFLGESEAGAYTLGFTFATLLMQLSLGGLDQLLLREIGRAPHQSDVLLGSFLTARFFSSSLCFVALALLLYSSFGYQPYVNAVVLVLGASLLPDSLTMLCQAYLIAHDRVAYITLFSGLSGAIKLVVGATILWLGGTALAAAWVVLGASILSLLLHIGVIIRNFHWPRLSCEQGFWFAQARAEWPIFIIGIIGTIEGTFDALMLSRRNVAEVGVYGAATAILSALLIVSTAFRQIILPIMAAHYRESRDRTYAIYHYLLRGFAIVTVLVCVSLTFSADRILMFIYASRSDIVTPVFQVAIWSFFFVCLNVPNGRLLLTVDRQAQVVPFMFAGMVLNVLMNIALQPVLGAQGAALARVASTGVVFLLCVVYVHRHVTSISPVSSLLRPICAGILMALAMGGLRWIGIHWVITLLAGWMIFAIALYVLRGVSTTDIQSLREAVKDWSWKPYA